MYVCVCIYIYIYIYICCYADMLVHLLGVMSVIIAKCYVCVDTC